MGVRECVYARRREREKESMQVGHDANGVADNGITPLCM